MYVETMTELYDDDLNPANIYLFKVNNRNTRKRCEIRSKLTIKTPQRHSGVFIVTYITTFSTVSIADFEQVNVSRETGGGNDEILPLPEQAYSENLLTEI